MEVRIADTRRDIRPEFLPYVFDRLGRQDTTPSRRHGGLGRGLSIVKYLVESHAGRVIAESPGDGLGATFTVRLPIAPPAEGEEIAMARTGSEDASG